MDFGNFLAAIARARMANVNPRGPTLFIRFLRIFCRNPYFDEMF